MNRPLIERLLGIDTPTLSNAIELLEARNRVTGFCDRRMRQLTPEMGVLCGYAVTVQAMTATAEPCGRDESIEKYLEVCRAIDASPKPAVVVFQEVGPHPEFSAHIGEVLATMFRRFGAVGVVSDAAVRDMAEIRALGFQAFAPGTVASHANFAIGAVQAPVVVCGLTVRPGDLVHGDENGLIGVPEQGRERLPGLAEQVRANERAVLDYLKGETVTPEGIRRRMVH